VLFNSIEFLLLFLPVTVGGFFLTVRYFGGSAARFYLLVASLSFYAVWDVRFLPLLMTDIVMNYWIGCRLIRSPSKIWFAIGVALNLSLIALFKYADFFIGVYNSALGTGYSVWGLLLPLGISFFTFQQIAFLLECYKGKLDKHSFSFHDYALFVTFFPQLIAGPICHPGQLLPQLQLIKKGYRVLSEQAGKGLFLIIVGLFKKVVVADTLASYVNPAFSDVGSLSFYDAWVTALGFSLQLYFDFSAYCEMAMGLALLFGISLPINFLSPYKATNIQDFWRRWHITLGQFLKTHLYVPLGGNRKGMIRMFAAAVLTMLLGGLWHGAGWQFIAWGALHGAFLIGFSLWVTTGVKLPDWSGRLITFTCVTFAWVMFRAESFADASMMYHTLLGANGVQLPLIYHLVSGLEHVSDFAHSAFYSGYEIWALFLLVYFTMTARNLHDHLVDLKPHWKPAAIVSSAGIIAVYFLGTPSTFLYFNF
jgi:D-alanyl-lipoteichoic acid acyltransferase DltB (MBOAT superfamily)